MRASEVAGCREHGRAHQLVSGIASLISGARSPALPMQVGAAVGDDGEAELLEGNESSPDEVVGDDAQSRRERM